MLISRIFNVSIAAPSDVTGGTMSEFRGYEHAHEETMRLYYRSLPEDQRRRYAGVEALKIGFGGIACVARVLGMSRRTVYARIRELEATRPFTALCVRIAESD